MLNSRCCPRSFMIKNVDPYSVKILLALVINLTLIPTLTVYLSVQQVT